MLSGIKIQYQLTPFVLRCVRCACVLVSVGCDVGSTICATCCAVRGVEEARSDSSVRVLRRISSTHQHGLL